MAEKALDLRDYLKYGTIGFILVLLILATVMWLGGCNGHKAEIILEDMHVGAWMAMDNSSWVGDPEDEDYVEFEPTAICDDSGKAWGMCDEEAFDDTYRHGVLFQMGYQVKFKKTKDFQIPQHDPSRGQQIIRRSSSGLPEFISGPVYGMERTQSTRFYGVYIKYKDDKGRDAEEWLYYGEEVLGAKEKELLFDWLDIREAASPCVIDPLGAYMMIVHPNDTIRNTKSANGCADPYTLTGDDYYCARNRSVHASVESRWLITYWSGDDFYNAVADETTEKTIVKPGGTSTEAPSHGDSHVSYTLELPKEVVVDRWLDGCFVKQYKRVTEVRILHHFEDHFHQGYPHTPMDGSRGG